MGYVIVECPGPKRSVLVNGTSQGDNKSVDGQYHKALNNLGLL